MQTMTQFDVFVNPIASTKPAFPYVVVMQSDQARSRNETIVAPMAPRAKLTVPATILAPVVKIDERDYVVVTIGMSAMPITHLKRRVATLATARSQLLCAVDLLFFGI